MSSQINYQEITVAELVAQNFKTAEVFKQHKIDFCCGGKRTIQDVCQSKGINENELMQELDAKFNEPFSEDANFNEWPLDTLIAHIVSKHHSYVKSNLDLISEFSAKVARVHGTHAPETVKINELWHELAVELAMHLRKEELIIFPFILNNFKESSSVEEKVAKMASPINMMEIEHEKAGEIMHEIERLSNGFQTPVWACNTYKVLYFKLQEFQEDLFKHIHLENNILFPKALSL